MTKKLKRIAAITMARNDDFFLTRWIKYYGGEIGDENLYIYLDGLDQKIPVNAGNVHIHKLPHTDMTRADGDKYQPYRTAEREHEQYHENGEGKGVNDVHYAHHDGVGAAARHSGGHSVAYANQHRDARGEKAHGNRNAPAVKYAA